MKLKWYIPVTDDQQYYVYLATFAEILSYIDFKKKYEIMIYIIVHIDSMIN
ncbi:MAG: hypothetical protein HY034_08740 [Nitrospirae bacterium]|nr:hypothetical protein [Nitrospirota bacterium]